MSERACVGVLRRAERRGKELNPILKLALEQQIERWRKYGSPLPVFEREEVVVECYDARGNGDGKVVPTITGDHNGHLSDYTALLVENKAFSIDPLSSNSMKSKNPHSGFHEETIAKCLDTSNGDPTKNQGGNVVVEKYAANSSGGDIASTIDAHYYLGCGARGGKEREFVAIAIDRAAFNQGENAKFDMGVDTNGIAFSCVAKGPGAVCYEETRTCYVVRRLTPLECCRLQGMPDFWTDGVEGSDAARYKLWGNGMALPNALYIMEGLVENDER